MMNTIIFQTGIRKRMRKLVITSCSAACILPALHAQEKPNIILFLVDDMGWQDTSVPFSDQVTAQNRIFHTPAMERLVKQGVKFTHAYTCPISSPTRVSLLTGANVTQTQVTNWLMYKDKLTDKTNSKFVFNQGNYNGLCMEKDTPHTFRGTTFTQLLQNNGYDTYLVGKAHFGPYGTRGKGLENFGFTKTLAAHIGGSPGSYLPEDNYGNAKKGAYTPPWGVPDLEKYHGTHVFLTEALTREAIGLMEQSIQKKHPFFMYLSHYAVHTTYKTDKRFIARYRNLGLNPVEADYCTLIEGMDSSLGEILDFVTKKNIAQNTIIIFLSDNGGYTAANRPHAENKNAPLRGGKGSCLEGGIRVPMIVYKNNIRPGTENKTPVIVEDLFPTILDMAGIKYYKTIQKIDGMNFMPALISGRTMNPDRPLIFHYPNNWGERYNNLVGAPESAIISGDYKLIYLYENDSTLLFNLKNDISEQHNLAGLPAYREIRQRLSKALSDRLRERKSNMPVSIQTGKRAKYPDGM